MRQILGVAVLVIAMLFFISVVGCGNQSNKQAVNTDAMPFNGVEVLPGVYDDESKHMVHIKLDPASRGDLEDFNANVYKKKAEWEKKFPSKTAFSMWPSYGEGGDSGYLVMVGVFIEYK